MSVPPDPRHHQARTIGEKEEEGFKYKIQDQEKGFWFSYEGTKGAKITTLIRLERG